MSTRAYRVRVVPPRKHGGLFTVVITAGTKGSVFETRHQDTSMAAAYRAAIEAAAEPLGINIEDVPAEEELFLQVTKKSRGLRWDSASVPRLGREIAVKRDKRQLTLPF